MSEKESKSEKKFEAAKVESVKAEPKSKADVVRESKLPEWQKRELLAQLEKESLPKEDKISFDVYCIIMKVSPEMKMGMAAYPLARDMKLASLSKWNDIFKNF